MYILKWSKIVLESVVISIITILVMALLSRYINRSLITAVAIVIASFLGTILGNITFLRINLKKEEQPNIITGNDEVNTESNSLLN